MTQAKALAQGSKKKSPFRPLRWPASTFANGNDRVRELGIISPPSRYHFRMMRYWFAAGALAQEAARCNSALTVIDLGCERGITQAFCDHLSGMHWTGLDWAPRAKSLSLAAYDEILQANFDEKLPLDDQSADVVICLHVFEHLPRPHFTISEIARVLKPGGLFIGATPVKPLGIVARLRSRSHRSEMSQGIRKPGKHVNAFSLPDWLELLEAGGMEGEMVCGGHFFRWERNPLENHSWWVRLNQLWGIMFPSLGGELFVQGRKPAGTPEAGIRSGLQPLRLLRLAAATALVLLAGLGFSVYSMLDVSFQEWLATQQDGNDRFYVSASLYGNLPAAELNVLRDMDQVPALLDLDRARNMDSHFLVSTEEASILLQTHDHLNLSISAHHEVSGREVMLVEVMPHDKSRLAPAGGHLPPEALADAGSGARGGERHQRDESSGTFRSTA